LTVLIDVQAHTQISFAGVAEVSDFNVIRVSKQFHIIIFSSTIEQYSKWGKFTI
jgi:hypothetical protein